MVELKISSGDYVKFGLAKREVEGRVLESHDSEIILLKLKSGYNIGILKDSIARYKVIRRFKESSEDFKIPDGKGKPSIGLVVTGGTIASKLDSKTGGVKPITEIKDFAKVYHALFDKANIKTMEVPFVELSENMSSEHWTKIAESVKKLLDDKEIQGVIVTHGSDTLHYTAAALSFFLRDLNKPVVLTFSQRSIDRASSDAEMNLNCAVEMALSDCAEVMIVGHASTNDDFCYALPGTKVRKMHTSRRDTFKAINSSPIAKIQNGKVEFLSEYRPRNKGRTDLDAKFSDRAALVKFYPGQKPDILDFYKEKYKGIVLEMTGLGHVASGDVKNSWLSKIKKLTKEGFVICAVSQTVYGRLNPKVYSTGRELEKAGIIYLEDMLSETAFVKLGWVLGHRSWKNRVKEKMLENFSGELNEILNE